MAQVTVDQTQYEWTMRYDIGYQYFGYVDDYGSLLAAYNLVAEGFPLPDDLLMGQWLIWTGSDEQGLDQVSANRANLTLVSFPAFSAQTILELGVKLLGRLLSSSEHGSISVEGIGSDGAGHPIDALNVNDTFVRGNVIYISLVVRLRRPAQIV